MKYAKSAEGQTAFNQRSALLSTRQRAAFILFDGKRTADEVLACTVGLNVTAQDVQHLIDAGFVTPVEVAVPPFTVPMPAATSPLAEVPARSKQQMYEAAYTLATQLTATLGLRGFRLNLAVEAAADYDGLVKLFPKIEAAAGANKSMPLAIALGLRTGPQSGSGPTA